VTLNVLTSVGSARLALANRLLFIGSQDVVDVLPYVDSAHGGLVVVGAHARATVRRLHLERSDLFLLEQPTAHTQAFASAGSPFVLQSDADDPVQPSLFATSRTVDEVLGAQLRNGASLAVLPTGFVQAGDFETVTAVVAAANAVDRSDTILHLPLDYTWARKPAVEKIIGAAKRSRHPVAVSLGHTGDPGAQVGVADGLRRLVDEAPDVSLWFTDLCAIDGLARGALAAAIGVVASNRHIVGPGRSGYSPNPADRSPNVLLPQHLRYAKAANMTAQWFASSPPLSCSCPNCDGKPLDRFDGSRSDARAAHRHNAYHLAAMHGAMLEAPSRAVWWTDRLNDAALAHTRLSLATNVKVSPQGALKRWIECDGPSGAGVSTAE
jgi:hypothetical protein